MLLGRVIGTVVATIKYEGLKGVPLLFVQPLDRKGTRAGKPVVCADATKMAGPGELVLYEGGREAALTLDPWFVPVDHSVVGLVDAVTREDWKNQ
jgi:microcompartment protein CcmK/EutM